MSPLLFVPVVEMVALKIRQTQLCQGSENDSIEHAFFDCQSLLKLCDKSLQW